MGLALCPVLWPSVPQWGAFVVTLGRPCGGECNPTTYNYGGGWCSRWNVSKARSHGIYMQSRSGHEWHEVTMGWYMVYMTNAVRRGLSVQDRMGLIEIKAKIKGWWSKWKMSGVRKCTWGWVKGSRGEKMHKQWVEGSLGQELHEQYVEGSLGKDMHMEVEGTLGQEMHVGVEGDPAY